MENWNDRLKEVRTSKNFTQQFVADKLGITRSCYSNYEQGIREPTFSLLKEICLLLDTSADYLIGVSEN